MGKTVTPTFQDWLRLELVVDNVEMIISDAYDASQRSQHQGLLALLRVDSTLPATASKLSTASLLNRASVDQVLAALPGADNLGINRSERLEALSARLMELTAYQWLVSQSSFNAARKFVEKKRAPPIQKEESLGEGLARHYKLSSTYGKDTKQFLLLKTFLRPLSTFFLYENNRIEPPFPTKNEFAKAVTQARQLERFFKKKFLVFEVVEVSPFLQKALSDFVISGTARLLNYTKPKGDATLKKRIYLDAVVQGCWSSFGDCSATLIRYLLDFADYNVDDSDLKKKIRVFKERQADQDL